MRVEGLLLEVGKSISAHKYAFFSQPDEYTRCIYNTGKKIRRLNSWQYQELPYIDDMVTVKTTFLRYYTRQYQELPYIDDMVPLKPHFYRRYYTRQNQDQDLPYIDDMVNVETTFLQTLLH